MYKFNVFKKGILLLRGIPLQQCALITTAFLLSSHLTSAETFTKKSKLNYALTKLQQEQVIRGTVTSSTNNEPLAGVTVKVIGTTIATSTNAAGQFEIKASPNQSLEFIYLGHTTQVIPITLRD